MNQDILQHVFHYNPFTKQWACVHRDGYLDYMNGKGSYHHVTYADSIDLLLTQFTDDLTQSPKEEAQS